MPTQTEKAQAFRTLHERSGAFVIPNPWDPGSARLLAVLGFEALTSTSAGFAFSRGLPDYGAGRDAILAHVADLAAATDLPVAADLENGFGDDPQTVAETIRLAGATGIVGGSIEDATGRADAPIYSLEASAERIRAAVEAARSLSFPFTLTARAENHLHGRNDLADTIRRLQAYQDAGADVLYAPGLKTHEEIATVLREVDRPVNVMMGFADGNLSVAELAALGVKRVSVGGALARAALGAFLRAAEELRATGTFSFAHDAAGTARLNGLFAPFAPTLA
ncbi:MULTISPECIES: isocitrate lyase/PEP mutase family protein [Ralstonia solanacearum species complex]|uniref:Isocitrate lyase/phosphoenolpyruvate mutase family protein n=2 Tax=Ralstonia solanacearum species complex TaxID=3116862 RepID=A0ABX7ZT88_9RALS|nr:MULTISPECIES: oxaloacetate decarboxylase [Ralstonia solanacearum species complex]AOE93075.1 Carboxyvinyl-carboxyphosphonate phosphorylmutase [Ralstonia solanacearum]APF87171.1 2-methylisocitrate lyase [Ralstonia solanacearum FJAT-1458]AST86627.1 2-methylisocitrate lyase [Ralstonia pseudosolanacearum]AXV69395.1 2-methylisocitrate lyase [Ralstonia solanacearum]AXV95871.1 2-methylisocitrate lyase [Ralstonia solanacearum]